MDTNGLKKFDFEHLFTFEMANNHQGLVAHGKKIIAEAAAVAKEYGLKAAVKLQFRDIPNFIHPAYLERKDVKHIPRFLETALSKNEFRELVDEIKRQGLISMATPFDEASVDTLSELGVEVIKVASCSSHDWPLLQRIADAGKPIIVSVGGLEIQEIDKVVSFFEHRGAHFALMYCVAIYPTPFEKMHLKQIEVMKNRYPHLTVGFSTHEPPSDTSTIGLAYAKGARIFEKHIGVPTESVKLNSYSANPIELRAWVRAYKNAVSACGDSLPYRKIDEAEKNDLRSLMRCVFSKVDLKRGEEIRREDVFFAIPLLSDGHLKSGDFRSGFHADHDYAAGEAIDRAVLPNEFRKQEVIYSTVHAVKGMLNNARIPLSHDFTVEISHHYGLPKFHEVGCVIIDCFNREYAKKLVIALPGQRHPVHYHKVKDETFQVLYGTLDVDIEGKRRTLYPGDTIWVPRGVWHGFKTDTGVIFEEVSTTAKEAVGDSYYVDKEIAKKPRAERKTRLLNWGRHQFDSVVDV